MTKTYYPVAIALDARGMPQELINDDGFPSLEEADREIDRWDEETGYRILIHWVLMNGNINRMKLGDKYAVGVVHMEKAGK